MVRPFFVLTEYALCSFIEYKKKYIRKSECNKILELAENLIDVFIPIKENHLEALNEAIRLEYSAYDMLYLTLARRMGAILATLDHSLNVIAKKEGIDTVDLQGKGAR